MDNQPSCRTRLQIYHEWIKNSQIEHIILQDLLNYLIVDISYLPMIISRFIELHDAPEKDNLSGIVKIRQGLRHWRKMAEKFLALDVKSSSIKEQTIQIYYNYMYSEEFQENTELMKSPFDSVQTMMKTAIHVSWYKIFVIEKGRNPKFLSGPITTPNEQHKFDRDYRKINKLIKPYHRKAMACSINK